VLHYKNKEFICFPICQQAVANASKKKGLPKLHPAVVINLCIRNYILFFVDAIKGCVHLLDAEAGVLPPFLKKKT
jgi:hypothetical protein